MHMSVLIHVKNHMLLHRLDWIAVSSYTSSHNGYLCGSYWSAKKVWKVVQIKLNIYCTVPWPEKTHCKFKNKQNNIICVSVLYSKSWTTKEKLHYQTHNRLFNFLNHAISCTVIYRSHPLKGINSSVCRLVDGATDGNVFAFLAL